MYGSDLIYPEWANQAAGLMTAVALFMTLLLVRIRRNRLEQAPPKSKRQKFIPIRERIAAMTDEQKAEFFERRRRAEELNDMQRCWFSACQKRKQRSDYWNNIQVVGLNRSK